MGKNCENVLVNKKLKFPKVTFLRTGTPAIHTDSRQTFCEVELKAVSGTLTQINIKNASYARMVNFVD